MGVGLTGQFHRSHTLLPPPPPPPVLRHIWHLLVLWWYISSKLQGRAISSQNSFHLLDEYCQLLATYFSISSTGTSVSSSWTSPVNKGAGKKTSWLISGNTSFFYFLDYFIVYSWHNRHNQTNLLSSLHICEMGKQHDTCLPIDSYNLKSE